MKISILTDGSPRCHPSEVLSRTQRFSEDSNLQLIQTIISLTVGGDVVQPEDGDIHVVIPSAFMRSLWPVLRRRPIQPMIRRRY